MSYVVGIIILFAFIFVALITLIIMRKLAAKFLLGDFIKTAKNQSSDDESETEEMDRMKVSFNEKADVESNGLTEDSDVSPQPICIEIASDEVLLSDTNELRPLVGMHTFAARAQITLRMEFNKSHKIVGCVLDIDGLNYDDKKGCPDDVCFHVKIRPQCKYKTKTNWTAIERSIEPNVIAVVFILGPLRLDKVDSNSKICFRMYGRRKSLGGRSKCFGESSVPLSKLTSSEGTFEIKRRILPKSKYDESGTE